MSTVSVQDPSSKKPDTKTPDKKQDPGDEGQEEEEEEEGEEYEDDYGSRVVATLCRKVKEIKTKPPTNGAKSDLVIAVVVTSSGNRHDAKKCADAYIKRLKGDKNALTCDIIAGDTNKRKKKEKEPKEEDELDASSEDGDDEDGESIEPETAESSDAQEERVDYTPKDFLARVYGAKSTNAPKHPLGGGVTSHIPKDVTRILETNYQQLLEAKNNDAEIKSTWLVMPKSEQSQTTTNVSYYANSKNKVVVVVLSTQFFYPSGSNGRVTIKKPILVCNVPYGNGKGTQSGNLSGHYKGIFDQIDAFLTLYNAKTKETSDKIGTIAISYPKSLIGKRKPSKKKAQKQSKPKSKNAANKSAKPKVGKGKQKGAKSQTSKSGTGSSSGNEDEDEDEDEDEEQEQEQEDEASGEESDPESSDGSESESDEWLRALKKWAGDDEGNEGTEHDIEIKLMYDDDDNTWNAPAYVKKYFENAGNLLKKFPNCIETTNKTNTKQGTVDLDELKTTMFVCDLEPGKRVGNNNDGLTTGGVFGQWVPMHFTAAYIDETRYAKDSVEKIEGLIKVVFTNTDDTTASSGTTEK